MAAISKAELEALERQYGLGEDGLTYPMRLSRITKVQKGEKWVDPSASKAAVTKRGGISTENKRLDPVEGIKRHPLYGKTLLITPLMTADKNRALYYDEPVGPDLEVEEISAGAALYSAADDVDRMVGDYKIVRKNDTRKVIAKAGIPKIGQEITFTIGKDLVPVVRGNDGQRGYVWAMPSHTRQIGDTIVQIHGLRTIITQVHPELLPKFSGKPVMMHIDGNVIAASIPLTDAILKEHRRKEKQDAKLGLV